MVDLLFRGIQWEEFFFLRARDDEVRRVYLLSIKFEFLPGLLLDWPRGSIEEERARALRLD